MRKFKIHPDVACCAYKSGVLHDKTREYPETMWPEGEAMERVKRGFLIEVKTDKKESDIELKKEEIKDPKKSEILADPEQGEDAGIVRGKVKQDKK